MKLEPDVLVIGGGMAGLAAGILATQQGAETILLRKGQSATSLSSGAVDMFGYLPGSLEPLDSPTDGLLIVASLYPFHPYSILGMTESSPVDEDATVRVVSASFDWLKSQVDGSAIRFIGDGTHNIFAVTALGTSKPTCLVQDTMDNRELGVDRDDVVLFAGIRGHPDFSPTAAARSYTAQQMSDGQPTRRVAHCVLDLSPFGMPYNISSIEMARHMDHRTPVDGLAKMIKREASRFGATWVAIPPFLGVTNARENHKRLEEEANVKLLELLSFPPSVPGLRLQNALEGAYHSAGGKMMVGYEAKSATVHGGVIDQVTVAAPRRQYVIHPKTVVLATGKFIGGGLGATERGLHESLMDLTTFTGNFYPASDIRPVHYTNTYALSPEGHPIFACGLSVDADLKPVERNGAPKATNLFAAGSNLAGYDYVSEKCGLGVALSTGYTAGMKAADMAKEG